MGVERYPEARDLYQLTETLRKKHNLPALGIGIIHGGKIVGLGVAGERVVDSGDWATLDDAFDIASCSKSVTATLAAMLVEDGKIRWNTTLAEAFPELKTSMLPCYASVTLEQLLRHRSGLDRIMDRNDRWMEWNQQHTGKPASKQRLLFVATALQKPPRYPPGTDEYYCNDGYVIAGSILERAAGKPLEALAQSRLFQPLGLDSLQYGAAPKIAGHEDGWFGKNRRASVDPAKYGSPPFGSPGGFLSCSVPDLLRYLDFHNQGEHAGHALLRRESFQHLHSQVANRRFALGWEIETRRDARGRVIERSIFHGGYSGYARANMWFVPETNWGTVIVMNHGRGDGSNCTDIFYALLKEFGLISSTPVQEKAP
ncbi:MAG: serine hydrolase domain-containing protein [Nibricoccus sp.]